jgi:mRNA interferase HigB
MPICARRETRLYKPSGKVWPRSGFQDSFDQVRHTFPSADLVGDLVVFNIRGNRYRLVARFIYAKGRVYIRRVLTHVEYGRGDWKE